MSLDGWNGMANGTSDIIRADSHHNRLAMASWGGLSVGNQGNSADNSPHGRVV